ncbi:MAG: prephenate dehydratase [Acidimicrobiales bacterium]
MGFLGPAGTFTEEALFSDPELAAAQHVALGSFGEVLEAVENGSVDIGFVALENSIEGTVMVALDKLIFEHDLWVVGEVVISITQNLVGIPGTRWSEIKRVVSFPVATAQCRRWMEANIPRVEEVAATSTAEAVRQVRDAGDPSTAAIGPALAADRYGLAVLASGIEDHDGNQTRFVALARPEAGIPQPSGHDKTSVVCFQSSDRPGSLQRILGQFASRDINLVKLESRPTKRGLGEYCFIIDFEGHVDDEVVADCLRDLHATLADLKFLGSYPAAGEHGEAARRDAHESWKQADAWIAGIRAKMR